MKKKEYLIDNFTEKNGYIIFDTPYGDRYSFSIDNLVTIGTMDGDEEIAFWLKGLPKPLQFAIGCRDFGRCLSRLLCFRLQKRFNIFSSKNEEWFKKLEALESRDETKKIME